MSADNLSSLEVLSAALSSSEMLVQGAGGNTSIKLGEVLWVKASGKWLADAVLQQIFVPLDLPKLRSRLQEGSMESFTDLVMDVGVGLRPSIETSLHAVLPHPIVLHVHSIRALSWAVQKDCLQKLDSRLGGLRWCWIPYVRPGLPLTEAVRLELLNGPIDIFVLANHGIVVGGDSCLEAYARLMDVEQRLDLTALVRPRADLRFLEQICAKTPYTLPPHVASHSIAFGSAFDIVAKGSLYPDHVVMLGPGVFILEPEYDDDTLASARFDNPPIVAIRDRGVIVRSDLSRGALAMCEALGLLVERIPNGVELSYLSKVQEDELMNWDSEKYRKDLQV
jgi:rhamnose utilization protein RhaD (predicted bifunctional aldolase and dehydrogenase)